MVNYLNAAILWPSAGDWDNLKAILRWFLEPSDSHAFFLLLKLVKMLRLYICETKTKYLKHLIVLLTIWHIPQLLVAKNVIKQETMSFDACLKVIDMISEQSGFSPKLSVDTDDRRVAEFKTLDGAVFITCDRSANMVTISTN